MVLLDDAPPYFIAHLSPPDVEVTTQGSKIRAQRPVYLEQQRGFIDAHCSLIVDLIPIVVAYAEPTLEDMWGDWTLWM